MKYRIFVLLVVLLGFGATAKATNFISDLMVAVHESDSAKAKKLLTDKGYTVIHQDLNKGGSGHYIYLGYKTSTNVADAITGLLVVSGSSYAGTENQTVTVNGATFQPINYSNKADGTAYDSKGGNLNRGRGANASDLYLYYTKQNNTTHTSTSTWKPITGLAGVASTTLRGKSSYSTYVRKYNGSSDYSQLENADMNAGNASSSASYYIYLNVTGTHVCSLAYQLVSTAQHKYYCTVCGYTRSTATCTFTGNYISANSTQCYRQCSVCGLKTYTNHSWSGVYTAYSATQCYTPCVNCNYQNKVDHMWSGWQQAGSSHHRHGCSRCNYEATQTHVWTYTESTASYHLAQCSVCSYWQQVNHVLVTDAAATEPTCTTAGHTEAYHCSKCTYSVTGTSIPALGHQFDEYGVCTRMAGEKHYSHAKGDVTCDGHLSVEDVVTLVHVVMNKLWANADYNDDGKLDLSDITALVNDLLGR
ncbi:MAG: hypothetical protein J6Y39_06040 [Bacteroidaceae bacterium]|nr:hypothetical protein [Bacteroidaceae bacterium]